MTNLPPMVPGVRTHTGDLDVTNLGTSRQMVEGVMMETNALKADPCDCTMVAVSHRDVRLLRDTIAHQLCDYAHMPLHVAQAFIQQAMELHLPAELTDAVRAEDENGP